MEIFKDCNHYRFSENTLCKWWNIFIIYLLVNKTVLFQVIYFIIYSVSSFRLYNFLFFTFQQFQVLTNFLQNKIQFDPLISFRSNKWKPWIKSNTVLKTSKNNSSNTLNYSAVQSIPIFVLSSHVQFLFNTGDFLKRI